MSKKVKFLQAVELGGVGYHPQGGAARDGVYMSVSDDHATGWHYEALKKDRLIVEMGEGEDGAVSSDKILPEFQAAFKFSNLTENEFLLLSDEQRKAYVAEEAEHSTKAAAKAAEDAVKAGAKANSENEAAKAEEKKAKAESKKS